MGKLVFTAIWVMLVIQSLISFLSFRKYPLPIIIRQENRSILGVSPSGIYPGGFRSFIYETVSFHYQRSIHSNNNLSTLCKDVQTQIWDPGVPNIGSEYGGKELRLNHFNKSRVTLFSAIIFDVGSQFPKTPTILVHGGVVLFLRILEDGDAPSKVSTFVSDGETFNGLEVETKLRSNLITRTCFLFLSMIQGSLLYQNYNIYSLGHTGVSMFMCISFVHLKIFSTLFWCHWRYTWIRRGAKNLRKEHNGTLPALNLAGNIKYNDSNGDTRSRIISCNFEPTSTT